jgi:2-polyprenyl-6-methoxyphenol hydroxylase-like FAD-dependent oxidoreductase
MSLDFLIVGGGIGGAVLAQLLGRAGKRVLVLERDAVGARPLPRPEVLWPATVRVIRPLLPRGTADATLLPVRGLTFVRNRRRVGFQMPAGGGSNAAAGACFTDPALTRRRLTESGPFELRRGVHVSGLILEGGRVVGVRAGGPAGEGGTGGGGGGQREILARWTVGDDGAHSVVRRGCGLDFAPRPLPMELLCFGCDWPGELPAGVGHMWVGSASARSGIFLAGVAPLPGGRAAGLAPVRPGVMDDPSRARADWRRFCAANPVPDAVAALDFPHDLVRVRPVFGNAPRYGTDGAVLIGDAAHPVTPAGGQGANLAVADAVALAEVALENPSDFLREYERRRRPAAERSLRFSSRAATALRLPDPFIRPLFTAFVSFSGLLSPLLAPLLRAGSTAFRGQADVAPAVQQ